MKIGFKNFRKFTDFPPIVLSPITFLVGPNNSGKSSFIKGVLLLVYNLLKNKETSPAITLDNKVPFITDITYFTNTITKYNWGDYDSSLNYNSLENYITFNIRIDNYIIDLEFGLYSKGEIVFLGDLSETVPIRRLTIKNDNKDAKFKIEYTRPIMMQPDTWECSVEVEKKALLNWINDSTENINKTINWLNDSIKNKKLRRIEDDINDNDFSNNFSSFLESQNSFKVFLENNPEDIFHIKGMNDDLLHKGIGWFLHDKSKNFRNILSQKAYQKLIYIETHNANHRIAWNVNDKNDFVAQTIFEYISKNPYINVTEGYKFINRWMKKFGLGERFLIQKHFNGEIYTVDIIHDKEAYREDPRRPGSFTPLGNMGTGSIQIFAMLLKIAIAIDESHESGLQLVVVEEPEQNSHPSFQSQLAEMFYDAYEASEKKINFLIETHSEYLIRRTQVMVAKEAKKNNWSDNDLDKNNPFRVYYFPEKGLPYDMIYRKNGKFFNPFGKGFFNVSDDAAIELFDMENSQI